MLCAVHRAESPYRCAPRSEWRVDSEPMAGARPSPARTSVRLVLRPAPHRRMAYAELIEGASNRLVNHLRDAARQGVERWHRRHDNSPGMGGAGHKFNVASVQRGL